VAGLGKKKGLRDKHPSSLHRDAGGCHLGSRRGRGGPGGECRSSKWESEKKSEKNEVTVSDTVVTSALNSRRTDRGRKG